MKMDNYTGQVAVEPTNKNASPQAKKTDELLVKPLIPVKTSEAVMATPISYLPTAACIPITIQPTAMPSPICIVNNQGKEQTVYLYPTQSIHNQNSSGNFTRTLPNILKRQLMLNSNNQMRLANTSSSSNATAKKVIIINQIPKTIVERYPVNNRTTSSMKVQRVHSKNKQSTASLVHEVEDSNEDDDDDDVQLIESESSNQWSQQSQSSLQLPTQYLTLPIELDSVPESTVQCDSSNTYDDCYMQDSDDINQQSDYITLQHYNIDYRQTPSKQNT